MRPVAILGIGQTIIDEQWEKSIRDIASEAVVNALHNAGRETAEGIFLAPVIGMVLGLVFAWATAWLVRKKHPARINRTFRRLQLVSACLNSLGHGGNDAQKTMGIITSLLLAGGLAAVSGFLVFAAVRANSGGILSVVEHAAAGSFVVVEMPKPPRRRRRHPLPGDPA